MLSAFSCMPLSSLLWCHGGENVSSHIAPVLNPRLGMCQPFPAPCFGASATVGRTASRERARGSLQSSCSRQQLFVVQSNFIFTHSSLRSLLLLLSHPCIEEWAPLSTIQHHQSLKVLSPDLPAARPSAGTSVSHVFELQCSVNRKSESQLIPCLAKDTQGRLRSGWR